MFNARDGVRMLFIVCMIRDCVRDRSYCRVMYVERA